MSLPRSCACGRAGLTLHLPTSGLDPREISLPPPPLATYGRQESRPQGHQTRSWSYPSLVAALGKAGPIVCLGSTAELAMDVGIVVEPSLRARTRNSQHCLLLAVWWHGHSLITCGRWVLVPSYKSGRTGFVPHQLHHLGEWTLQLTWAAG